MKYIIWKGILAWTQRKVIQAYPSYTSHDSEKQTCVGSTCPKTSQVCITYELDTLYWKSAAAWVDNFKPSFCKMYS